MLANLAQVWYVGPIVRIVRTELMIEFLVSIVWLNDVRSFELFLSRYFRGKRRYGAFDIFQTGLIEWGIKLVTFNGLEFVINYGSSSLLVKLTEIGAVLIRLIVGNVLPITVVLSVSNGNISNWNGAFLESDVFKYFIYCGIVTGSVAVFIERWFVTEDGQLSGDVPVLSVGVMDEGGLFSKVWWENWAGVVIDIILAGDISDKFLVGSEPVSVELWYFGTGIDDRFPITTHNYFPVNLLHLFL